jgi:hypothetical protein
MLRCHPLAAADSCVAGEVSLGALNATHGSPEHVDCAVPSVVDPVGHGLQLDTSPPNEKVPAAHGWQVGLPAYPGAHTAVHNNTITTASDANTRLDIDFVTELLTNRCCLMALTALPRMHMRIVHCCFRVASTRRAGYVQPCLYPQGHATV